MLATIFIWLSVAVIALKLADIFLSKAQKEWLSNGVVRFWNILDECKGWSFADWLKKPQAKLWFAITLGLGIAVVNGYTYIVDADYPFNQWKVQIEGAQRTVGGGRTGLLNFFVAVLYGVLAFVVTLYFVRPIFAKLLEFRSATHLSVRLVIILVGSWTIYLLLSIVRHELVRGGWWYTGVALWYLAGLIAILNVCAATIFISIAMAYVASGTLYVGEFVVRRIAEYPKGPVLALSALIGGIAAVIKAFGYD
jgi:hypothetical protein